MNHKKISHKKVGWMSHQRGPEKCWFRAILLEEKSHDSPYETIYNPEVCHLPVTIFAPTAFATNSQFKNLMNSQNAHGVSVNEPNFLTWTVAAFRLHWGGTKPEDFPELVVPPGRECWSQTRTLRPKRTTDRKTTPFGPLLSGWWLTYLPLWKILKSNGIILPNIWKIKKCSKPPTRLLPLGPWEISWNRDKIWALSDGFLQWEFPWLFDGWWVHTHLSF